MPERYFFDQLSPMLWSILDNTKLELSYNLLLTPIKNSYMNWQITIASVASSSNSDCAFMVYESELFSNCFYNSNKNSAIDLVYNIVDLIEEDDLDINNLIELAAMFGGLVNNESIKLPPVTYSLDLN